MPDTVPPWLATMRALTGTTEAPGAADNPVIMGWSEAIARRFPRLGPYARRYDRDATAWCGQALAYVMAMAGIQPPYDPGDDLGSYLWVDAWLDWGTPVEPGQEQLGDVLIFATPHHVTLYEGREGNYYLGRGGNQSEGSNRSDRISVSRYAATGLRAIRRPPAPTATPSRPELKRGDTGPDVEELQRLLGLPVTGVFDTGTDAAVGAFQARHGLDVDGIVGEQTWPALLAARALLRPEVVARIAELAAASPLATYAWNGRGVAPRGYIKGMAAAFAQVYAKWKAGDPAAKQMAAKAPPSHDATRDALAWYEPEFRAANMGNAAGPETLRRLFVLLIGLGMRESSGRYCEGRDLSAGNVSADTAEAGLFQQSWNSHAASPELDLLLAAYRGKPDPLLPIFQEGVTPRAVDLVNFGEGDGAAFQRLCKASPTFAVEAAGLGLRVLRQHWGPVNRREVEIVPEADALLRQVQGVVDTMVMVPIDGEVLPPIVRPETNLLLILLVIILSEEKPMDDALRARLLQELGKPKPDVLPLLVELLGGKPALPPPPPPPPPPLAGVDVSQLMPLLASPLVRNLLAGKAITLNELLPLLPALLSLLRGQPVPPLPPALPPPAPAEPPPALPAEPILQKPSVALSTIALAITTLLQAGGAVGTPFGMGTAPTQTGTIATLAPILTGLIGATGGWGMALRLGLGLLGGLVNQKKGTP
jgi:hypothetical protein